MRNSIVVALTLVGCGGADPRVDDLLTRVDDLQATVATLQTENAELRADVDALQASSDTTALTAAMDGLTADMTAVQSDVASLQADVADAEAGVAGVQSDVASLEDDLATARTDLDGLSTDVAGHGARITALEATVATHTTTLATNASTLADHGGRIATLEGHATTVDAAVATLGTDLASVETDIADTDAKAACLARLGTWDGTVCTEFATIGCAGCTWTTALTACPANRHLCSTVELQSGAIESLYAQLMAGLVTPTLHEYVWSKGYGAAGAPNTTGNQIYYPQWSWYGNPPMTCAAGAAPMMSFTNRNTPWDDNQIGAQGCYDKTYNNAIGLCCRDGVY